MFALVVIVEGGELFGGIKWGQQKAEHRKMRSDLGLGRLVDSKESLDLGASSVLHQLLNHFKLVNFGCTVKPP
jgi:hypothetical protein